MSMISLLLHKSEESINNRHIHMISLLLTFFSGLPLTCVNNKDIIWMYLGYNLFISQRTIPIDTSFVAGITSSGLWLCLSKFPLVVFTYKRFLCTKNRWLLYYPILMMHWLCIAFILWLFFLKRYLDIILTTEWYHIYQPINFIFQDQRNLQCLVQCNN